MNVRSELMLDNHIVGSKSRLIIESVEQRHGRRVKVTIYLDSDDCTGVVVNGDELTSAIQNALNYR